MADTKEAPAMIDPFATINKKQATCLLRNRLPCAPTGTFEPFVAALFGDREKMTIQDILEEVFVNSPVPFALAEA